MKAKEKKSLIIKKQGIVDYLNEVIVHQEAKIQDLNACITEENQHFKRNFLLFATAIVLGISLSTIFANTFLMIPALIVTTPSVAVGFLGLPLTVIMTFSEKLKLKKEIGNCLKIITIAEKKQKNVLSDITSLKGKEIKLHQEDIIAEFTKNNDSSKKYISEERIPELDKLLFKDYDKKEIPSTIYSQTTEDKTTFDSNEIAPGKDSLPTITKDEQWFIDREIERELSEFSLPLIEKYLPMVEDIYKDFLARLNQESLGLPSSINTISKQQLATIEEEQTAFELVKSNLKK